MSEEEEEHSQPTLTQYIENNHKLLSIFSILVTLSVLANNLPDKDLGRILSFCLFTLSLLIGIEIFVNFPPVDRGRLSWFREIMTFSMLMFVYVWIVMYWQYLMVFLYMAVCAIILLPIFYLFKTAIRRTVSKISWLNNKNPRTREELIPVFGAMILMILVVVILRHLIKFILTLR
jgi:Ca2+/Na+ antiporter